MKNDKLTNFAIIDTDSGEITQYLTTTEKSLLEEKYTSANPSSKCNDTDTL